MTDKSKIKLSEYLLKRGVKIDYNKKPPVFRCPNPAHTDKKPSAVLYENPDGDNCFCPVCDKTWDIYDVAGLYINSNNFPDKKKEVEKVLNLKIETTKPKSEPKPKQNKSFPVPVALDIEKARNLFTKKRFLEMSQNAKWGNIIAGFWLYHDKNNKVIGIDVRFENESGKKSIINFWYNGKSVVSKNSPPMIYNLYDALSNPDKPILIHEGCKAAETGKALKNFISVTWNRGSHNVKNIDWTVLKGRQIYIFPDDDPPGIKAALYIKSKLPDSKIIQPIEKARKIKKKGADIVEILQVMKPEEITEYIINSPEYAENHDIPDEIPFVPPEEIEFDETPVYTENKPVPFKILGIADDERAYFLDRHDRLYQFLPDSINKNKLLKLAPLNYWLGEFGYKNRVQWDEALDFIMETAGRKDFNIDYLRGRGAWRDHDGKVCYHDGIKTIGEFNGKYIFLKKNQISIGIEEKPIDKKICQEIGAVINKMSFSNKIDTIRCLAWATLAPFAGALPWRPAVLITGSSGSGKTTVVDYVIKKIAKPYVFSGAETTPAFIRQFINRDSSAIVLEEAETDTDKKRKNRNDLFSLMRQSTSDDAPLVGKGSKDGKPVFFSMKNMFAFIAISPEVESIADDNRIFRVNMKMPKDDWKPIREKLKELITPENCRGIRALTWNKFQCILDLSEQLTEVIQDITGKDNRSSFAEGLIFATYFLIWQGRNKIENEKAREILQEIFKDKEKYVSRDEVEEVLDRLLDESVFLPDSKTTLTIRQILTDIRYKAMSEDKAEEYKNTVERYGLKIDPQGYVSIAINHHEIMKITEKGRGYQRILWRHPGCVEKHSKARIAGKTRSCVKMIGILEQDENVGEQEEIPF